ncbi:MAG: adenylate/guanylate cyclase domain-containing protein, partial [Hyphomicrobiales bacterium]
MSKGSQRKLAAIVMADVAGYSRLMGADEAGTLAALSSLRGELFDPMIAKFSGRMVKAMGDGFLLEFPSVVTAVEWAIEIQRCMAAHNMDIDDGSALQFRIGIHLGDVIAEAGDIFGDGVNVAARVEGLAAPGAITISDDVHRQVRDKLDARWREGGAQHVKNIARPITVWHWSPATGMSENIAHGASVQPLPGNDASIAIMPFENMSGDADQEYFADGITEDIITEISKVPDVMVISRNSTFTFKGKAAKAQEVCASLGVRYVMEGSVRKSGARVRISAQLVEGASGRQIWAERYDRELSDIFAVQDDVTEKIVSALQVKLSRISPAPEGRLETSVPEAYDFVLRGREQYRLFAKASNLAARQLYQKAIALDPDYAAAYAGLAGTCMHEWMSGDAHNLDEALQFAVRAHELGPSLPIVQEALGNVYLFRREHEKALAAARQWIEVEPGNADAYANFAGALHFNGEPEEAIPLIEKAMRLNPFYPFFYILYLGQALFALERFEEALEAFERSVARNREALPAHLYLTACL